MGHFKLYETKGSDNLPHNLKHDWHSQRRNIFWNVSLQRTIRNSNWHSRGVKRGSAGTPPPFSYLSEMTKAKWNPKCLCGVLNHCRLLLSSLQWPACYKSMIPNADRLLVSDPPFQSAILLMSIFLRDLHNAMGSFSFSSMAEL